MRLKSAGRKGREVVGCTGSAQAGAAVATARPWPVLRPNDCLPALHSPSATTQSTRIEKDLTDLPFMQVGKQAGSLKRRMAVPFFSSP